MNKQLQEFVKFCEENPELTFWKALKEFSKADVIYKAYFTSSKGGVRVVIDGVGVYLKDTYEE